MDPKRDPVTPERPPPTPKPWSVRLLRKLAIAALAVPVLAIIYLSAGLRRSLFARTGFAIGLGAILAFGVILTMRPAPTTATPPSAILPLTAGTFRTVVATDRALGAPVNDRIQRPHGPGVGRGRAQGLARDEGRSRVGQVGSCAHDHAAGPLGRRERTTRSPSDAGALRGHRRTHGDPRPCRVPDPCLRLGATIAATEGLGKRVGVGTAFGITFDGPVDPLVGRREHPRRARRRGHDRERRDRRWHDPLHVPAVVASRCEHAVPDRRRRRAGRRRRGDRPVDPRGSRPSPRRRSSGSGRSTTRSRWLARRPSRSGSPGRWSVRRRRRRSRSPSAARPSRARSRGPRATRSWSSSPRRPCPMARRS